jgi:NAD+ synthase (glutamine-hydrolysing)
MSTLRIALSQINLTVGDIGGNAAKIEKALERARESRVDVILFPELPLTGYPPEDLLLKPRFVTATRAALQQLLPLTEGLTAVVGFPDRRDELYNAAAVLHDGRVAGVYHKALLPNYSVFDEDRYFAPGDTRILFERPLPLPADGSVRLGVSICEDIWYPDGPPDAQAAAGAEVLLAISASPYQSGKTAGRERMLATRAVDNVAIVAFCNLVGGQDELVFDGGSAILDERGEIVARARPFQEDFVVVDVGNVLRLRSRDPRRRKDRDDGRRSDGFETVVLTTPHAAPGVRPTAEPRVARRLTPSEEVYEALVMATRDYTGKNGFEKVVLGLSGGIDSALVAAIAVDALGRENVICVWMPSRHSSEQSTTDAAELARRLGVRLETIPIEPAHQAYLEMLSDAFAGADPGVAAENLQSRARGNVLMALSNRFDWLVLTTGNKSELAVGYATIYGDMAGGFAVIKDVPKCWVYRLCRYRNELSPVIPESILSKPPSAELAPNQRDTDTLPEYEVLDAILAAYVERDCGAAEIVALGYDEDTVLRVIEMVDRNEYKRRQAPPGPKITGKAFGKDRRLPITNHYRARQVGQANS